VISGRIKLSWGVAHAIVAKFPHLNLSSKWLLSGNKPTEEVPEMHIKTKKRQKSKKTVLSPEARWKPIVPIVTVAEKTITPPSPKPEKILKPRVGKTVEKTAIKTVAPVIVTNSPQWMQLMTESLNELSFNNVQLRAANQQLEEKIARLRQGQRK
jgi:hypothetical protein